MDVGGILSGSLVLLDKNLIQARLTLSDKYIWSSADYAFYLLIDGLKKEVSPYSADNFINFKVPEDVDVTRLSVRGFIRDSNYHEKNYH